MSEVHDIGCPCPVCVAARREMVRTSHPLMRMDKTPTQSMIPTERALELEIEARDDLRARLAIAEANIQALGGMT